MTVKNIEPKYIQFVFAKYSNTGKTEQWNVATKEDAEDLLGVVKFYAPWYCYAFFPFDKTLYEKQCLRDIAEFCEQQNKLWRIRIKMKKATLHAQPT